MTICVACHRWRTPASDASLEATFQSEWLLLRQDRKSAPASGTVHREVPPVEREDAGEIFAFGNAYQRGVGQVHWQIAVFLHQLTHAWRIAFVEGREGQALGLHATPEGFLTTPRRSQQVHGFGERRPDGDERIAERFEGGYAGGVMGIVLVENGDQRAGVNENGAHGPSRRRSW